MKVTFHRVETITTNYTADLDAADFFEATGTHLTEATSTQIEEYIADATDPSEWNCEGTDSDYIDAGAPTGAKVADRSPNALAFVRGVVAASVDAKKLSAEDEALHWAEDAVAGSDSSAESIAEAVARFVMVNEFDKEIL